MEHLYEKKECGHQQWEHCECKAKVELLDKPVKVVKPVKVENDKVRQEGELA